MNRVQTNLAATNPIAEKGIYSLHGYIFFCLRVARWTGEKVGWLMMRRRNIEFAATDIEPGMHYVVATNHQTFLDPWMIIGRLPLSVWRRIGMPRSFAANRFFRNPILGNYLRSMGAFPAKPHPTDPYGIEFAMSLLDRGYSISIFPEGHITLNREQRARDGVMLLARYPNVRIIPFHFEWKRPRWQARFDIGIGKPFDASKMTAQEILDRVYGVPVR